MFDYVPDFLKFSLRPLQAHLGIVYDNTAVFGKTSSVVFRMSGGPGEVGYFGKRIKTRVWVGLWFYIFFAAINNGAPQPAPREGRTSWSRGTSLPENKVRKRGQTDSERRVVGKYGLAIIKKYCRPTPFTDKSAADPARPTPHTTTP